MTIKKLCTTCGHGATDKTLHEKPKPPPAPPKDSNVVAALARAALANQKPRNRIK